MYRRMTDLLIRLAVLGAAVMAAAHLAHAAFFA
jgi:hypothetical protein